MLTFSKNNFFPRYSATCFFLKLCHAASARIRRSTCCRGACCRWRRAGWGRRRRSSSSQSSPSIPSYRQGQSHSRNLMYIQPFCLTCFSSKSTMIFLPIWPFSIDWRILQTFKNLQRYVRFASTQRFPGQLWFKLSAFRDSAEWNFIFCTRRARQKEDDKECWMTAFQFLCCIFVQ